MIVSRKYNIDKILFAFGFVMIVGSALIEMDHRDNQNFICHLLSNISQTLSISLRNNT